MRQVADPSEAPVLPALCFSSCLSVSPQTLQDGFQEPGTVYRHRTSMVPFLMKLRANVALVSLSVFLSVTTPPLSPSLPPLPPPSPPLFLSSFPLSLLLPPAKFCLFPSVACLCFNTALSSFCFLPFSACP